MTLGRRDPQHLGRDLHAERGRVEKRDAPDRRARVDQIVKERLRIPACRGKDTEARNSNSSHTRTHGIENSARLSRCIALSHGHKIGDVLALDDPGEAVHDLTDALHVLGHGVRDVNLEFFFKSKQYVDPVQGVDSQLGEGRIDRDRSGLKVLLPGNNFDHFFVYVHHVPLN